MPYWKCKHNMVGTEGSSCPECEMRICPYCFASVAEEDQGKHLKEIHNIR